MRRQIMLSAVMAATTAILVACEPKVDAPKPAPATPATTATSSPSPLPSTSPTGSPGKPGASPEAKKADTDKDAKVPPASPSANK